MGKTINLQPWLNYFELLKTFEKGAYLEMQEGKHEAYITLPAACLLALDRKITNVQIGDILVGMPRVLRHIRAYAAWLSRRGKDYMAVPFALHIVEEKEPHDLLHTLVISSERKWWRLWMPHDSINVISYTDET
jgi:hypothetical protein